MSNSFIFGVHRGSGAKLKPALRKIYDRAAKKHGAQLIEATLPGVGYQRWFTAPNLGAPFDRAIERAVYSEIEAEIAKGGRL
ncbi:MAG TPA: hypothetical protein VG937_28310 [Polyangiaceae bacterium]|nr:hypothetical protein [Polyangiaceae bacterium]